MTTKSAQSDAPSAEPPYPTNAGLPVNVAQWKEMFDAGECLNCGDKLTGKAQWECCWFGLIPEMWWRMTAAYAALRTAKIVGNVDLKQLSDWLDFELSGSPGDGMLADCKAIIERLSASGAAGKGGAE